MKKTKIAVFVSGGGTNFEAIIRSSEEGKIPHGEFALVLSSNSEAYALERAKNHGIESVVVSRKAYGDGFEAKIIEELEARGIEMIVLAGFMSILSADFTDRYDGRIINVHPSLIPSFCGKGFYGLRVHEAALEYGVKVTGATVHYVNSIPDGGKIIAQRAVYIEDGDTPEILQKRVMEQAEWIILPEACEKVAALLAEKE